MKGGAISTTGRGGLWGYAMLKIPHCLHNRLTDGGEGVSLTYRPVVELSPQQAVETYGVMRC
jgi:hypothetical protein